MKFIKFLLLSLLLAGILSGGCDTNNENIRTDPPPIPCDSALDPDQKHDTATTLEGIQECLDAGKKVTMDQVANSVGRGWRQRRFVEDDKPVEAWQYHIMVDGRQRDASLVFTRATGLLKRAAIGF